jgi:D-ribose pyranase
MRQSGIINAQLASALARLRHTNLFVVSDSGFPAASGVEVIDLAVIYGLPGFAPVLEAILAEIVVEKATMAIETETYNPVQARLIRSHFGDVAQMGHTELKALAASAKFVVRTGDDTPYSNVVLQAGVAYG